VAGETGIPLATWLPWALHCEAKSAVSWDDPRPLLRGVWLLLWSRMGAVRAAGSVVRRSLMGFCACVARLARRRHARREEIRS